MNRCLPALAALVLFAAHSLEARERREIKKEIEVAEGQRVRIEIPVAELEIEATERDNVAAELTVRCRWDLADCRETLEDIGLEGRSSSRRVTVELDGLPRWHSPKLEIDGTILVPRAAPLEVKMGVARLDISGVERDLRVDLGVGEVRLWLPEQKVGEVWLDVGVGQVEVMGADPQIRGRRSFFVGNEVQWDDGAGEARVDVEVGVGEIILRLE